MVRRLGTVCLLALLWAVARCAADPFADRHGREALYLQTLIRDAVKEAVQPMSAELSSQRALLSSLDGRMELLMKWLGASSESINLSHARPSSVNLQSAELEAMAAGLESSELEASSARLSALQTGVDSLKTDLDSPHESVNSSRNSLHTRLGTLESGLDSDHESRKSSLNSLQTSLHDLILKTNLDSRNSVNFKLNSLHTRLDSLEFGLNSHQESVNSSLNFLHTRLDTLKSGLNFHHESGNLKLNSLHTRLDTLESGMDSHHESGNFKLNSLQTSLDSLQTGLTSQLQTANTRLDSVSNQLDHLSNYIQTEQKDLPRDCSELPVGSSSGVYLLQLSSDSPQVKGYCDMFTDGGGWTVVQRRDDIQPREDFFRDWAAYRSGFGNLTGEFWWGLEKLWLVTDRRDRRYELRVDLENFESEKRYALYQNVQVSPESDGYRLTGGDYTGSAGDSLSYHFGQKFSTKDRDQDNHATRHCAEVRMGGWWYNDCYYSHLNGLYLTARVTDDDEKRDVVWESFGGFNRPLKTVEMKMRPIFP